MILYRGPRFKELTITVTVVQTPAGEVEMTEYDCVPDDSPAPITIETRAIRPTLTEGETK